MRLGIGLVMGALLAFAGVRAEPVAGKVAAVTSGDTFILSVHRKQHKIGLAGVNAPDGGQPYAAAARLVLMQLIAGKTVHVTVVGRDRYGRSLAWVEVAGRHINQRMLELGAAWVMRTGGRHKNDKALVALEQQAQRMRVGLWALPESERSPPWLWERQRQLDARRGARCGAKRLCTQMLSCAEARHYLNQCGLVQLDTNHDGIPCEGLCQY